MLKENGGHHPPITLKKRREGSCIHTLGLTASHEKIKVEEAGGEMSEDPGRMKIGNIGRRGLGVFHCTRAKIFFLFILFLSFFPLILLSICLALLPMI